MPETVSAKKEVHRHPHHPRHRHHPRHHRHHHHHQPKHEKKDNSLSLVEVLVVVFYVIALLIVATNSSNFFIKIILMSTIVYAGLMMDPKMAVYVTAGMVGVSVGLNVLNL